MLAILGFATDMFSLKQSSIWDSLFVFGGAALRGNQEPDLRCLLVIVNLYRTLVGSEPTYVVWGRGCDCETAT